MAAQDLPIIDSHIHLCPEAEVETLAWTTPGHPLAAKRLSLDEYRAAAGAPTNLRGLVLIEADRRNDQGAEWKYALMEVEWLARIARGEPRDGEGCTPDDAALCLAIVPWAPMNLGRARMEEYLAKAEQAAGPVWPKVKGFRYLLQDKDIGAGVTPEFIESMKLLGEKGYTFDAGVDQHRRGRAQLEELVAMLDHAYDGVDDEKKKLRFIINHCCKPNLEIIRTADPSFVAWRSAMFTLAKCDGVYMKLSGLFAEMPAALRSRSPEEIFEAVQPWLAVVLAAFGPSRIMFASDWPVCTVDVDEGVGEGVDKLGAWKKWRAIVERLCDMASLPEEDQKRIWAGTAVEAYGLDV